MLLIQTSDTCLSFYLLRHDTLSPPSLRHHGETRPLLCYPVCTHSPCVLRTAALSTKPLAACTSQSGVSTYRLHALPRLAYSKHTLLKLFGMQTTKQELEGNLPGQRTASRAISARAPLIPALNSRFLELLVTKPKFGHTFLFSCRLILKTY